MSRIIEVGDQIYYMKRPKGQEGLPDERGEWLAGAGRIISIIDKNGYRIIEGSMPSDIVKAVRVITPEDDVGEKYTLELNIGEFTYSMKNYLKNLLA